MMRLFLLSVLALAISGCEAVPTRITERFTAVQPQTKTYDIEQRTVFAASQRALKDMGFTVTRSGQAQGIIAAQSRIVATGAFKQSTQFTFDLVVRELDPQRTEVSALLKQQTEGDFKAGATNESLRQHGYYSTFFSALEQALNAPAVPAVPVARAVAPAPAATSTAP